MYIFWGINIGNNSKIVFGIACIFVALFIMGYLLYSAKKEKQLLKYDAKKIRLLIGMFRHIIASCALMIAEYLVLRFFNIQFRQIIAIICISLVITTIIATFLEKL